MKVIDLTKVASWLYLNDIENPLRFELYKITKGLHPVDNITPNLSKELKQFIKTKRLKEIEKTAKEFKKIAQFIRKNDYQSKLAKRIFKLVKDVPPNKILVLSLTLDEFLTLESLEN
jgi:hypothetical protein